MRHFKQTLLAAAAICLLCARPATAQQPAGYKDPGIATLLSVVIPGGGQMYAGETGRGAMLLGVGMGGIVLGTALSMEGTSGMPLLAGSLVYLGSWVYGIMDASDSADRMNARRGLTIGDVQIQPSVGMGAEGGARVGLELRF